VPYFEPAQSAAGFTPIYVFLSDEATHLRILNGAPIGFQLVPRSLSDQFHPAIKEISHGARDFKAHGDGFGSITKTDPLHSSRIVNRHPAPAHVLRPDQPEINPENRPGQPEMSSN
jgi:hypothetical protein